MSILRFQKVTREVGDFVILDGIEAAIALGDRIGLVGPNGGGKTTLLRLAAGRDEPDRGEVVRKRGLTIGLLAQEAHFDEAFMAAADLRDGGAGGRGHLDRMAAALAEFEHAGRATEPAYANLQHEFEVLGGYTLDQRVEAALSGLGFARDEWTKPPTAMSGGEQTRASLARLVIADPDLLLLDEPTNHLDLGAIEWLEDHLRGRGGSLLVASHDRAFLDATVDPHLGAARPAADRVPRRLQRVPPPARGARRPRGQGRRAPRPSRSPASASSSSATGATASSRRCTSTRRGSRSSWPRSRRPRRPGASSRSRTRRSPAAAPTRSGEIVVRLEGLAVGYLPGRGAVLPDGSPASEPRVVATVPFLAAQRGERIGIVGPERRRQDHAAAHRSPGSCRRSTGR